TWWSARTGNAGEHLQIDLGKERDVRAIQVNLAEQDCALPADLAEDRHCFVVAGSTDGEQWTTLIDRSHSTTATPHFYSEFERPARVRYVRVTNVFTPGAGKFAV